MRLPVSVPLIKTLGSANLSEQAKRHRWRHTVSIPSLHRRDAPCRPPEGGQHPRQNGLQYPPHVMVATSIIFCKRVSNQHPTMDLARTPSPTNGVCRPDHYRPIVLAAAQLGLSDFCSQGREHVKSESTPDLSKLQLFHQQGLAGCGSDRSRL